MREATVRKYIEVIFLLLQAVLYILFLSIDIIGGSIMLSIGIKYGIIMLCFFYALLSEGGWKSIVFICTDVTKKKDSVKIDILLLQTALFFTLISDLFILVLDYYFYGVLTFILVQQLYSIRLAIKNATLNLKIIKPGRSKSGSSSFIFYLKRLLFQSVISGIILLVLLFYKVPSDRLLIASVFYFICILSNTFSAIRVTFRDRSSRNNLLYGLGMLLFLLCDINVGLFNLSGFIALPKDIYSVIYFYSSILMWAFYAPAQVLIALSCHSFKLRS